jgi:hypothetical protein
MDLDYNTRLAAIQRNEKLAQIMQQQAFQPIDIQSYQGIQAPISPLSGLAKVLQAYMGSRSNSDEERIKLNQEAKAEAQTMLSGLQDRPATQGRAAVMGMPEIPAQPATSFKPMGADYEDNPNLQTAPSGNVETAAVPFQPAVAPQAAIPAQPAMQLSNEEKNKKLIAIMMGQNPYASPVAKLMYESLEKQNSGPLAEYKLYAQQAKEAGQTPLSIDAYKTKQILAGRAVSNNVVNMPAGAPIAVMRDGKQVYVQMGKDGKYVQVEGISPVPKETDLKQKLADAGIYPNLPDGTPNPEFTKYAKAALEKETELSQLITARDALPKDHPNRPLYEALIAKTTNQVLPSNASVIKAGETTPSVTAGPAAPGTANTLVNGVYTNKPIPGAAPANAAFQGAQAGAEASARVEGASTAQAKIDLPKVVDNAQTAIQNVQELLNHPAFKSSVGMGLPGIKYVPGTPQADYKSRMEQVQGGAFLTAIDTLRGTGAITEIEGAKATAAKNRMSTATSEDAFNKAAKDYLDIIEQGVKQTYIRAGKDYVPLQRGPAPKAMSYGDLK